MKSIIRPYEHHAAPTAKELEAYGSPSSSLVSIEQPRSDTQQHSMKQRLRRALWIFILAIMAVWQTYAVLDQLIGGYLGEADAMQSHTDHGLGHALSHHKHHSKDPFNWKLCPNSKDKRWKCGRLTVPLNYHNSSDHRTVTLESVLFQVNPKKKSKHTILINPGGPGGSGSRYTWSAAEKISSNYTDSTLDVLGFDPRGVNASTPHITCTPRDAYKDRWNLLTQYYREKGDKMAVLQRLDSYYEAYFASCYDRYGDVLQHLTTATVARDMDSIRQALGEEELYYYGVSYGTGLGQTYTQMFPDRVGRMLLDGLEYMYDGRTTTGFGTAALHDIERAYNDGFLGECLRAGPAGCALAESNAHPGQNETLQGLQARMETLFNKLIERPASAFHPEVGPGVITYTFLIELLYASMYNAALWPGLARRFAELERGNTTQTLLSVVQREFAYDPEEPAIHKNETSGDLGLMVICSDSYDAPRPDLEWYLDLQRNMTERSFIGGDSRFLDVLPCRNWKWTPSEVYRGDLHHNLSHPILLIAETYDPATPLYNGRRLARDMGPEARLVVHHGYGHSSRDRSNCTESIKRDFFIHGQLPEKPETNCFADTKPYPIGEEAKIQRKEADLTWLAPMMMRHHKTSAGM